MPAGQGVGDGRSRGSGTMGEESGTPVLKSSQGILSRFPLFRGSCVFVAGLLFLFICFGLERLTSLTSLLVVALP